MGVSEPFPYVSQTDASIPGKLTHDSRWPYVDVHPALDRIPEIKINVDELLRRRDRLIDKLIAGVRDWDDYLSTAGEIRGLNAGITTPYRPRSSTS